MPPETSYITRQSLEFARIVEATGKVIQGKMMALLRDYSTAGAVALRAYSHGATNYLTARAETWARASLKTVRRQELSRVAKITRKLFPRPVNDADPAAVEKARVEKAVERFMAYARPALKSIDQTVDRFLQLCNVPEVELALLGDNALKLQEWSAAEDNRLQGLIADSRRPGGYETASSTTARAGLSVSMANKGPGGVNAARKKILSLLAEMAGGGKVDFVEINGRYYQARAYAEMLARTELSRAAGEATKQEAERWGADLVIVSAHDDPCPICVPLELQVFSISGRDPDFPPLPDWPIHPNCEHSFNPTTRAALRAMGRLSGGNND